MDASASGPSFSRQPSQATTSALDSRQEETVGREQASHQSFGEDDAAEEEEDEDEDEDEDDEDQLVTSTLHST